MRSLFKARLKSPQKHFDITFDRIKISLHALLTTFRPLFREARSVDQATQQFWLRIQTGDVVQETTAQFKQFQA